MKKATTIKELKAPSLYSSGLGVSWLYTKNRALVKCILTNKRGYVDQIQTIYKMHATSADPLLFCCRSKTILDSCPYLSILALRWYPQEINGHKFEGKEGDYIRIPEKLLDVLDAEIMSGKSTCESVQFTEYSSQQWFISGNSLPALKNKVIYHYKELGLGSDFCIAATLPRMH